MEPSVSQLSFKKKPKISNLLRSQQKLFQDSLGRSIEKGNATIDIQGQKAKVELQQLRQLYKKMSLIHINEKIKIEMELNRVEFELEDLYEENEMLMKRIDMLQKENWSLKKVSQSIMSRPIRKSRYDPNNQILDKSAQNSKKNIGSQQASTKMTKTISMIQTVQVYDSVVDSSKQLQKCYMQQSEINIIKFPQTVSTKVPKITEDTYLCEKEDQICGKATCIANFQQLSQLRQKIRNFGDSLQSIYHLLCKLAQNWNLQTFINQREQIYKAQSKNLSQDYFTSIRPQQMLYKISQKVKELFQGKPQQSYESKIILQLKDQLKSLEQMHGQFQDEYQFQSFDQEEEDKYFNQMDARMKKLMAKIGEETVKKGGKCISDKKSQKTSSKSSISKSKVVQKQTNKSQKNQHPQCSPQ